MKKQRTIGWNFFMNSILSVSSVLFPLITFPYVSRILQPSGLGKVTFAISVMTYFALFARLGIPTYGVRACAQVRDDRQKLTTTAYELLIINAIMTVLAYVAFFVCLFTVPKLRDDKPLYLVSSSMMLFNLMGVEWLYRALEEYAYITVRSLVFKLISLVGMFVFVHKKEDYLIYCVLSLTASHFAYLLNLVSIRKHIGFRGCKKYDLKRHIKPVLIFFAMTCATTIYTNLDTVMLGFMKSDVDVGLYNVAVKTKNVLLGVVASLGTVVLPRVSYYVEKGDMKSFWNVCRKALRVIMLISVPMTVYFILFARQSVMILAGNEYLAAVSSMRIIMPTIIFIGLTNILGIQILVPLGKEKLVLYSVILGAVVDVLINLLLIPSMGAAGAAVGTLIAEIVVLCFQSYVLSSYSENLFKSIPYLKLTGALLVGSLCSAWIGLTNWNAIVQMVFSCIMFFGGFFTTLLIAKELLVKEMIQKLFSQIGISIK